MSEDKSCSGSCSSCGAECSSREEEADSKAGNVNSRVNKVIGVISGKGGVGKSFVTGSLACALREQGKQVGIMDADITGPSIPREFGVTEKAMANDLGFLPNATMTGIDMISMNMLLENDTDPVVWRGPIIGNAVQQFWTDVQWGDKDVLLIDMPPGTGDVALTVFQSVPVDGIIIVTTPQDLVSMIVEKAVKMAEMMNIPILGIVENMSWLECPDCGKKINLFGKSHLDDIVKKYNIPVLAQMPIRPENAELVDAGRIEDVDHAVMTPVADAVNAL